MKNPLHALFLLVETGAATAALLTGALLSLYLLYRLIRLVQWLRKSPQERAAARHPLFRAPGREQTAYLILCLERALEAYSQAPEDWRRVLELLRDLPGQGAETAPFFRAALLLPFNVLPCPRREDPDLIYDDLADLWDPGEDQARLSQEDLRVLRDLYLREGWRMCVFAPLLQAVYDQANFFRECGDAYPAAAIEIVERAEDHLHRWRIPPPQVRDPRAGGDSPLPGGPEKI